MRTNTAPLDDTRNVTAHAATAAIAATRSVDRIKRCNPGEYRFYQST
jgi:hypothetical protein